MTVKVCKAFAGILCAAMGGIGGTSDPEKVYNTLHSLYGVNTPTGNSLSAYTSTTTTRPWWNMTAAATILDSGIVLGTGTSATSYTDYIVETLIPQGSADNKLDYGACSAGGITEDATGWFIILTRPVTNNGTVTITVGNMAVYQVAPVGYDNVTYFCAFKETLGTPIDILAGETWTFSAKIHLTLNPLTSVGCKLLLRLWSNLGSTQILDTSNTLITLNLGTFMTCHLMLGNAGTILMGLVAGTTDTAFDKGQYKLLAIIPNGSASGSMNYGTGSVGAPSFADPSVHTGVRVLSNDHATDDVVVKEIAAYVQFGTSGSFKYFCIARKVVDETVPHSGGTLTIALGVTA